MFGANDMLLGALAPMVAAAAAFALAWKITRRPGAAWSAGVMLGYATGVVALETRDVGLLAALETLVRPSAAIEKAPIAGLVAILPALLAAALGTRRRWRWLLAAAIAVAVPLWLLWGGKYLPPAEARAFGVDPNAWSGGRAVLMLGGIAAAVLAAWWSWEAVDPAEVPRLRAVLAVAALAAASMTAGMTSSFTLAHALGALTAAVGGSAIAERLCRLRAGPEAAAGPILIVAATVLVVAVGYSSMPALLAGVLWASLAVAVGWLPGRHRSAPWVRGSVRTALCAIPIAIVLWQAGTAFVEAQRQQQEETESNPYAKFR